MFPCPICNHKIGYPYIIKHDDREMIVCNLCYERYKAVVSLRRDHLDDLKMSRARVNKYSPDASKRIVKDDGFLRELLSS